jgi:hypothetical protein
MTAEKKSAADFMIYFSPRVTPLNGGLPSNLSACEIRERQEMASDKRSQ